MYPPPHVFIVKSFKIKICLKQVVLHQDWGRRREEGGKNSTSRKESVGQKKTKRNLAEALQLLQTQLQVPGQELERHLAAQQKEKEKPGFLTDQTPIPLKEATISTKLHHGICTSASHSVI